MKIAGCRNAPAERKGLTAALSALNDGDTFVVWKLDRLGRSLPHLVETVADLGRRGVGFVSLTETIDSNCAGGRLVFHLMAALAEFERALISERTKAGIAAARKAGRRVGRRPALTPEQIAHSRELRASGKSPASIARLLGVSRPTLYRHWSADDE